MKQCFTCFTWICNHTPAKSRKNGNGVVPDQSGLVRVCICLSPYLEFFYAEDVIITVNDYDNF